MGNRVEQYATLDQSFQSAMRSNSVLHYREEGEYYAVSIGGLSFLVASVYKWKNNSFLEDIVIYREYGSSIETHIIVSDVQQKEQRKHRHDFYEIIYMMYGTMLHSVSGRDILLKENEVMILNENIPHKETFSKDAVILYIDCPVQVMQDVLKECRIEESEFFARDNVNRRKGEYIHFTPRQTQSVRPIIDKILEEQSGDMVGRRWLTLGLLARLIAKLVNKEEYIFNLFSEDVWGNVKIFKDMERYLEARSWDVKKGELAEHFHYNEAYLSHLLKKYSGLSLVNYCMEHKLSRAEYLLSHSDISINEIISQLGYQNKTFFYRKFKQKYGVTPLELRKSIQISHL